MNSVNPEMGIPSQAAQEWAEGVTTRPWSPERTVKAHERGALLIQRGESRMYRIYGIESVEGKNYVGCTKGTLSKRWREHRCLLRAGKHACAALQADWLRLGEKSFGIWQFDEVEDDQRRERELYWMDWFGKLGTLYNEHRISFQPPMGAQAKAAAARVANGYRPSPESNLKRRLSQLGKPKGHGAKISATKRAKAMR